MRPCIICHREKCDGFYYEIWFCKGRVNFLLSGMKPMHGSTFPLAVIVFKRFNFGFPTIKSFYHKIKEVSRS